MSAPAGPPTPQHRTRPRDASDTSTGAPDSSDAPEHRMRPDAPDGSGWTAGSTARRSRRQKAARRGRPRARRRAGRRARRCRAAPPRHRSPRLGDGELVRQEPHRDGARAVGVVTHGERPRGVLPGAEPLRVVLVLPVGQCPRSRPAGTCRARVSSSTSLSGVANRVSWRAFAYDSSPESKRRAVSGSDRNARATRTWSWAVQTSMSHRSASQCAHESAPERTHPPAASSSPISHSNRAFDAAPHAPATRARLPG